MKASELIVQLQAEIDKYGDRYVDVIMSLYCDGYLNGYDGAITVSTGLKIEINCEP